MDGYESRPPGPQNALDIFAGAWTSAPPQPEGAGLVAGAALLFADPRARWGIDTLGGVAGSRVLELGPLEGGHSFMLERGGANEILGIEANRNAFLRCLVIKEIFGLERVHYACGDFTPYLRETDDAFDLVFASGVLYHQLEPLQLLSDIARVSSAVYLWTHYYDAERIAANPFLEGKLGPLGAFEFDGVTYSQAEYRYLGAVEWAGFCGGSQPSAQWLPREDILRALETFGFEDIEIAFEEPEHPNGPSFAIAASK